VNCGWNSPIRPLSVGSEWYGIHDGVHWGVLFSGGYLSDRIGLTYPLQ
jgi:hypothetical protein